MVKRSIPIKDLEKLSAYLDGQLNPNELVDLQNRLSQDNLLRDELIQMRRTRAVIQSLPRRKAPRNFTISKDMVLAVRPSASQPIFGFVSAVAILLLLVILVSDFLFIPDYIGMFSISKAPASGGESISAVTASDNESLVFPTSVPTISVEAETEKLAKEPVGGGAESSIQPQDELVETPLALNMESPSSAADEMPTQEGLRMFAVEGTPTLESPVVEEKASLQEPTEGVPQLEEAIEPALKSSAPTMVEAEQQIESGLWIQLLIWMAEVFMLLVALGSGLVFVVMKVKNRF